MTAIEAWRMILSEVSESDRQRLVNRTTPIWMEQRAKKLEAGTPYHKFTHHYCLKCGGDCQMGR